ncbi:MAG: ATP-binding protein [Cyanobacteria bacterium]|nr:ATP-binding protein [Cyanobacteriota bacterium]MDW8202062.1 AAA family ATPase [Cyanobacteriota bacterium SKYGB_h_bin112]
MELNLAQFSKACRPYEPLDVSKADQRPYYIDLSSVRGNKILEALRRPIVRLYTDEPTCQLFTGHIGCGKSTELLYLKALLEKDDFHVVYMESRRHVELEDADISDILLAIAGQVSASLEASGINIKPSYLMRLIQEVVEILKAPVEIETNAKFSFLIAEITTTTKSSPQVRPRFREHVEPRTKLILDSINNELLTPAIAQLKAKGKQGLVAIVDDLDRIENRLHPTGQLRPEYLFVTRADQLSRLKCHVIYTIPLILTFSNYIETIRNRFGQPQILPMVPVTLRNGSLCEPGIALLRQMVLSRAFPQKHPVNRMDLVTEVFDSAETLDRLCCVSGGHARNLMILLYECLRRSDPPFARSQLESVIQSYRNTLTTSITTDEWALLRRVAQDKSLAGEQEYETALKSLYVFEYQYQGDRWYDVNPVLQEAPQFQQP